MTFGAAVVLGSACAGPGEKAASRTAGCDSQVIVGFAAAADAATIEAIARDREVGLTVVAALQPNLLVLELFAPVSCDAAIAALRGDARVRSADLDARRQPQAR